MGVAGLRIRGHRIGPMRVLQTLAQLPDLAGAMIFGTPPLGKPAALASAFLPNPGLATTFDAEPTEAAVQALGTAFVAPLGVAPGALLSDFRAADPRVRAAIAAALQSGAHVDEVDIVRCCRIPLVILPGEHDAVVSGGISRASRATGSGVGRSRPLEARAIFRTSSDRKLSMLSSATSLMRSRALSPGGP